MAGFSELVDVLRLSDDEFGFRSGQLFENLGRCVEGVCGGCDGAEHRSSDESEGELGAVLEKDHYSISFGDAESGKAGSDFGGNAVGLDEGVGLSGGADDQTGPVGEFQQGPLEAVGVEGKMVGDGDVRQF